MGSQFVMFRLPLLARRQHKDADIVGAGLQLTLTIDNLLVSGFSALPFLTGMGSAR
jgi:hypothetical protein